MRWWAWALVGFFGTGAALSGYKRWLYRGHPRDVAPSLPGPPSSVEPRSCDDLRVIDNDAFALWLSETATAVDPAGDSEAFTTRLMDEAFPGCPWPPPDPLRWSITFEAGNRATWIEFAAIVGASRP